jgi:DNA-binding transcriptional LysR family regulator
MRAQDQIARRVSLRELRVLAAAVACGSVAKAARQLGLTQPAVSKALTSLEDAVGTQLMERSALGVAPTAAGRLLLARCTVIFDELRQAAREFELLADPTGGELFIGTGAGRGAGLVPAIITEMQRRRPAIRHSVLEGEQSILFGQIRSRSLDLALTPSPKRAAEPELQFDKLFEERLLVVAPVGHPLTRRKRLALADLRDERWILASPESYVGRLVADAFEQQGLRLPSSAVTTMSVLARFELLASGSYITTLPESLLRFSRTHPPVAILPMDPLGVDEVGIVRLKRRALSPVARDFIDCARQITAKLQPLDGNALSRLASRTPAGAHSRAALHE